MQDHARNYGFQSNKELMLYLKDSGYIRSNFIFDIMCSVDRKNFTTNDCTAYRDRPEAVAYGKTISAPHMHAEVLEQMSECLQYGKCALDIGSGSGYLTICMAIALGEKGRVIGIDCIPGFQIMASQIAQNHYPKLLQNNHVEYIVYDGRRGWPWGGPYDAIHIGVAAESIPETLIEQLAPGGCLVMPVGLREHQVLVSLKKSLNGNIQKKELMRVHYGTFTEVDLPWSSMVENDLILDQEIKNKNVLSTKSPPSNPITELFAKEIIKKPIQTTQIDEQVESKTLGNIDKKFNVNDINKDAHLTQPNKKIQCSLPKNIGNNKNESKTILEKIQIFEKKDDDFKISKSQEDIIIATKHFPNTASIGDLQKTTQSIHTNAENYDENLKTIELNEDANDRNDPYAKPLKENIKMSKSVSELECTSPKANEGDGNAQTVNEKNSDNTEKSMNELEKNICDFVVSKSQELDSFSEDSDGVSSVNTEIDIQAFYENCKNSSEICSSIQTNPKVYNNSKSFSKSLENFSTINEPVSKLRTSISTIIGSDKYKKKQTVREKIEIFEKNIQNCKLLNSQENITIKINSIPGENDNFIVRDPNENIQVSENSENNEVSRLGALNVHTKQTIYNDSNSFSKSIENLTKTDEPVSMSRPICSTIFNCDKTETVLQEIDIVKENTERKHNRIEQEVYIAEKNQNKCSRENVKKMEEHEASPESISPEFKLFKNEIKFMLNNFLSSEKENDDEIKLRQVNLHINRVHQVQLVNNLDKQEKNDSQNLDQNGKTYDNLENDLTNKNLSAENQDGNSDDLQVQMRTISVKVEQLQAQYDDNVKKLIATNEDFQGRIIRYNNLEKRLTNLDKKFKLMTEVLAKLIDKTNCHEKVLNIQLAITEKEEASQAFEKLKREQTEEKIDNFISAISRIGQEIKVTGSNFVDTIIQDKDEQSESLLSELNLIKNLLRSRKKNPDVENKSSLNNDGEFTDNENEMNLLKVILEEQ